MSIMMLTLFLEGNWKEYGWIKYYGFKYKEKTKIYANMIRSVIFLLQLLAYSCNFSWITLKKREPEL